MKINLAVKSDIRDEHLYKLLDIANYYGIKGIEIQELFTIMDKMPLEERVERLVVAFKEYGIRRLSYHFPIKGKYMDINEAKKLDLAWSSDTIIDYSKETIREAAIVAKKVGIWDPVPINFHIFGFTSPEDISLSQKENLLRRGEEALRYLREYANLLSLKLGMRKNGVPLFRITRENNPPHHGEVDGVLDFHPDEIIRTAKEGIYVCLDLAHMQQYINYLNNSNGELKGVELDKQIYPYPIDWEYVFRRTGKYIYLVHLNDAYGYLKEGEGLEIGKGEIDFYEILNYISTMIKHLGKVIFTIEIKDGHIHPEKVERSIEKIYEYLRFLPTYKRHLLKIQEAL